MQDKGTVRLVDMENASQKFTKLLSPFKIGKMELKNRFIFLPHLTGYAIDEGWMDCGLFSERNIQHYVERAKGGAAAVTVSQNVDPYSMMSDEYPVGSDPRNKENFRRLAAEVHKYGCKCITQLNHGGHNTLKNPPQILVAPSQMPEPSCHFNTKELEKEELEQIKDYYVKAATLQQGVGWDAVELKIAHDGLLRTFISPLFNKREDEYGGSFENRMRYPLEIIEAIREAVGPDYPIGIRLCVDEFIEGGYSMEYGLKVAKRLEEAGVDYLSTDAGSFSSFYMEIPPAVIPLGFALYMSAELKKTVDIPVIAFGRINDPVQAEMLLEEDCADLVGMCRQLICDPETPNKTMRGEVDDIRHCIACNEGCIGNDGIDVECVQNPGAGREKYFGIGTLQNAEIRKKVMVIGGGISGMKAAEIAAKRGHEVSLYEASDKLGGQVLLIEKMPYRAEVGEVYRYLKYQLKKYNVAIHMNVRVERDLVERENPDVIIAATGSKALIPDYIQMDEARIKVIDCRQAMENLELIGEKVLVFDDIGYYQASGVADYVTALGADTTVVTTSNFLGCDIEGTNNALLLQRLYERGTRIIASHTISKIKGGAVVLRNVYSQEEKEIGGFDTVIIAAQSRSDNDLYKELKAAGRDVRAVGDCVAPRAIEQVIFDAELAGREI